MVHSYALAVTALFPSDRFIGIEAACSCNRALISPTAAKDASLVDAMAYHSYPAIGGSTLTLSQFYGTLRSPSNLSASVARFLANLQFSCPSSVCRNMPVEIGEYQAGPPSSFSHFERTYAGAAWMAASIVQAMYANVSRFNVFDATELFGQTSASFEGRLYQGVLEHMTTGKDFAVAVTAPKVGGVFAILATSGLRQSLLLVNTNTTSTIGFNLTSTIFPVGLLGSEYLWSPSSPTPSAKSGLLLPSTYLVVPQGILLLNNY
jgi:hypothetical protein